MSHFWGVAPVGTDRQTGRQQLKLPLYTSVSVKITQYVVKHIESELLLASECLHVKVSITCLFTLNNKHHPLFPQKQNNIDNNIVHRHLL